MNKALTFVKVLCTSLLSFALLIIIVKFSTDEMFDVSSDNYVLTDIYEYKHTIANLNMTGYDTKLTFENEDSKQLIVKASNGDRYVEGREYIVTKGIIIGAPTNNYVHIEEA